MRTPQRRVLNYLDTTYRQHITLAEGVGCKASLTIPVAIRAMDGTQYLIGDADRWQKI